MRQRNWRLVILGTLLIGLAVGFYIFMSVIAPTSLDPKTMMQTVGSASGTAIGVSVMVIIVGLVGKKV